MAPTASFSVSCPPRVWASLCSSCWHPGPEISTPTDSPGGGEGEVHRDSGVRLGGGGVRRQECEVRGGGASACVCEWGSGGEGDTQRHECGGQGLRARV